MQIKKSIPFKDNLHYKIFSLLNTNISSWGLSENEVKVLAALYNEDYNLVEKVKDYTLRMKLLFSKETKDKILITLDLSYNTFNNILTSLRNKTIPFIVDNTIDEKYLQKINNKEVTFTIIFINDEYTTNN